ncbi:LemA family protein [Nitrososphaera sp.]|uniref:LemA family protein n=1 Tax=Nitrososphaera sp. TaxID=1971748 RepID=UPI003D6DF08C
MTRPIFYFLAALALVSAAPAFAQNSEVRRTYIFDNAGVISAGQEEVIHSYLRGLDRATTNEIVIYTIPSFEGHGIKRDGVEIQDRDMLANYIYNEVTLDGIKGIGKEGKDNGVLVLMSLERDSGGGSLRIEVGRGLEGDVNVQLQRRYDLIPNIVSVAQTHLEFERSVLENVTRLRTDWQRAPTVNDRVETSNQIEEALSKILVTYEQYPNLKADITLRRVMDELAGTENRIAVSRTYYNEGVRDFNVHLRTFPNNTFNQSGFLGLGPWGLQPYTPFEATAAAQATVPQVNIQP